MTIQAIVRRSYTVTATFTGTPTPEERKAMKAAGAEFKNGQWVKYSSQSEILEAPAASAAFAA
jgi:hypothetical protein